MAAPIIQTSFAVGEVSPYLFGRVDLTKYKLGAAKMSNFVVDYKGGAAKRAGTRFVGKTKYPLFPVRLVPFEFNSEQTYMLELGDFYMRVITNGGYVLNEQGGIYEIPSIWAAEDLKLLKWTQSADTMTFVHQKYPITELIRYDHDFWKFFDYTVGATSLPTPYGYAYITVAGNIGQTPVYTNYAYGITTVGEDGSESVLSPIIWSPNTLDMTVHKVVSYIQWTPVQGRQYYNVWKATTGYGAQIPAGTRLGFIGSSVGEYFVDANILPSFVRSPPTHNDPFSPGQIESVVMTSYGQNYPNNTSAYIVITDATGSGALLRPQVRDAAFVGAIVDDGGKNYNNPSLAFYGAPGPITGGTGAAGYMQQKFIYVEDGGQYPNGWDSVITSGGSGYGPGTTVSFVDEWQPWGIAGTGMAGFANISGGTIVSVTLTNEGMYYPSQVRLVFTDPGVPGSQNATGYAKVGPKTGTYPGAVAYYQQRLLFAGTENKPSTLWGSKPGAFHNFDTGIPITDSDSYEFTLASQQLNAIKYMIGMPGGLVVLTSGGAWQLSGTQQFAPITPTQIMATPQAFHGCADLPPITIGYEILFLQAAGSIVRNLSYNFFANIYTSADVTVLSSHLFTGYRMTDWAYAEEPDKIIWLVRDDGKLISFTFLKDQEVAGWSHHTTNGQFRSVGSVREGLRDVTYFAVDRMGANGVPFTSIERSAPRHYFSSGVEDAWYLDCALTLPPSHVGLGKIGSGPVVKTGMVFSSTVAEFTAAMVNKFLRVSGGKYKITTFVSATVIYADEIYPVKHTYYNEEAKTHHILPEPAGTWDIAGNTASVGGLNHLEGLKVSVLADGHVQTDKTVVGGSITLDTPASRVTVGLGYVADLQTLRLESQPTVQGRMKKIPELTIRVAETRGLWAGMTEDTITEIKERDPAFAPGVATPLITGDLTLTMDPLWKEDGQIWIKAPYPLPANILAVIPEVVLGDG